MKGKDGVGLSIFPSPILFNELLASFDMICILRLGRDPLL